MKYCKKNQSLRQSSALKIGSSYNTSSHWSGSIDEVRISSNSFGDAWFQHSYNNQKASSSFLDYDLSYLTSPTFTSDLNLTAVNGQLSVNSS